ncbi:MAG: PfkB family carbohydrate kinase [Acidimicrobiia bacterium]
MTGRVDETFPLEFYRRLGSDLTSNDVTVVADMHGAELNAFLEDGSIALLKVSDDELDQDGMLRDLDVPSVLDAMVRLEEQGASNVVVSRASLPALARLGGVPYKAVGPDIEPIDFRGAGDSMTAALAAATRRGMGPTEALRLACASGAANVTRRGLGSASKDLIQRLFDRVEVVQLDENGHE